MALFQDSTEIKHMNVIFFLKGLLVLIKWWVLNKMAKETLKKRMTLLLHFEKDGEFFWIKISKDRGNSSTKYNSYMVQVESSLMIKNKLRFI